MQPEPRFHEADDLARLVQRALDSGPRCELFDNEIIVTMRLSTFLELEKRSHAPALDLSMLPATVVDAFTKQHTALVASVVKLTTAIVESRAGPYTAEVVAKEIYDKLQTALRKIGDDHAE